MYGQTNVRYLSFSHCTPLMETKNIIQYYVRYYTKILFIYFIRIDSIVGFIRRRFQHN